MVYISRREHFNAAHKLFNENWSSEKNQEVFGNCANENWHGHNFELEITLEGEPDPETGFIVDLKKLGELVNNLVIDKLDHKNLNLDVDFMKGKMPTIEVLIKEIWKILEPKISSITKDGKLFRLKLHETSKQFAEYYGESINAGPT